MKKKLLCLPAAGLWHAQTIRLPDPANRLPSGRIRRLSTFPNHFVGH